MNEPRIHTYNFSGLEYLVSYIFNEIYHGVIVIWVNKNKLDQKEQKYFNFYVFSLHVRY